MRIRAYGVAAIGLLVLVLSVPYLLSSPPPDGRAAERIIRHHLRYQAAQRYAELYRTGRIDAQAAGRFEQERRRIDALTFPSVRVGRLLPDYVLGRRPRLLAKAVIRDEDGREETRYFNLGTGQLVVGESSALAWAFVL